MSEHDNTPANTRPDKKSIADQDRDWAESWRGLSLPTKVLLGFTAVTMAAGVGGVVAARGMDADATNYPQGTAFVCEGSTPVTVEPGDTLTGILVKNVPGVNGGNARSVATDLGAQPEFRGPGNLKRLPVFNYTDPSNPQVLAGETVDIPTTCKAVKP